MTTTNAISNRCRSVAARLRHALAGVYHRTRAWADRRRILRTQIIPVAAKVRSAVVREPGPRDYAAVVRGFAETVGEVCPYTPDRPGSIMMMIGTLGPGGAERQLAMTALGLGRRGLDQVSVTAMNLQVKATRFFLEDLENGGHLVEEMGQSNGGRDPGISDPQARAAAALPMELVHVKAFMHNLACHRPEIAHLWLDEVNVQGGLAAAALGVPRILLGTRSVAPTNFPILLKPYMRDIYRWLAFRPGVTMLNNSQAGARSYEEWLGLPVGHIKVLHNGFDFDEGHIRAGARSAPEVRARYGIPPEAPVVGGVFRLTEEKRPFLWVDAMALLRRQMPEAHFLLVGDGLMQQEVKDYVKSGGLADRLHMTGHTRDVFPAISAMDLLLLTSRMEGLPNVLLEAQALGVPAVTTCVGGAPEAVDHRNTGWVLERDDAEYIAGVLHKLLSDIPWRERARELGLEFVRRRFGVDRMLVETMEAYGIREGTEAAGIRNETPATRLVVV